MSEGSQSAPVLGGLRWYFEDGNKSISTDYNQNSTWKRIEYVLCILWSLFGRAGHISGVSVGRTWFKADVFDFCFLHRVIDAMPGQTEGVAFQLGYFLLSTTRRYQVKGSYPAKLPSSVADLCCCLFAS